MGKWVSARGGPVDMLEATAHKASKRSRGESVSGALREVAGAFEQAGRIGNTAQNLRAAGKEGLGWGTVLGLASAAIAGVGALVAKSAPLMIKMAELNDAKSKRREEQLQRTVDGLSRPKPPSFKADTKLCNEELCVEGKRELINGRVCLRRPDGTTLENCEQVNGKLSCSYNGRTLVEK